MLGGSDHKTTISAREQATNGSFLSTKMQMGALIDRARDLHNENARQLTELFRRVQLCFSEKNGGVGGRPARSGGAMAKKALVG